MMEPLRLLHSVLAGVSLLTTGCLAWPQPSLLVAHRGVSQPYATHQLDHTTCTAQHWQPAQHRLIENTLPAVAAAFNAGADVVEIDIHPTTDGAFAVFHDWTLDCRTNGTGRTRDHTLAHLKSLDVAHGYTADGGQTYPLRGSGVGALPSLAEVLATFPGRRFLLDIKSNDPHEGALLAQWLLGLPLADRLRLAVYGGNQPVREVQRHIPEMRVVSRDLLKRCLIQYALVAWAGGAPQACSNLLVLLPIDRASWLWGWPERLVEKFHRVGSEVVLVGPLSSGPTSWIDSPQQLLQIPPTYRGGLMTDRILELGPLIKGTRP